MCDECRVEYTGITDRRYHAQPDCCPACGPRLVFTDVSGCEIPGDPVRSAQKLLREGGIVAVKGLGGFHLACRADMPALALELRRRKQRDEKPFALMCADVEEARRYCVVSDAEAEQLSSRQRPIVLMKKKTDGGLAQGEDSLSHISENGRIGIMLPYTPIHFLLLHDDLRTLVMTSANLSDRPIIYRNEEALEELRGIADGFLMHDRDVHVRCDDSVMWVFEKRPYFARRSRGYVPYPVTIAGGSGAERKGDMLQILACGAEQKATFSLSKGSHVFSAQHIGDLKNIETFDNYESQIRHFEKLFEIRPEAIVCDLHPDYLSTSYASERAKRDGMPLLQVQHHYAHMASCMADNGLDEPVIGIIWDGTGLGTDGLSWGGEFLTGDFGGFCRRGTIRSLRLPGGDRAVHEIWRIAVSLLYDLADNGVEIDLPGIRAEQIAIMERQLEAGVNCPVSTSIGRLFDGVSALLGIRETVSYEGQGAILLEAAAAADCDENYSYRIEKQDTLYTFDYQPMLAEILADLKEAYSPEGALTDDTRRAAARFMNTLVMMAAEMAGLISRDTGIRKVVLSGGSFQNMYVLERLVRQLRKKGLEPYTHSRVSCNDEGLSLGQLMIARRQL